MKDLERSCAHCGDAFWYTPAEQAWVAERGLHAPNHCPTCRVARLTGGPRAGREAFPAEPPKVEARCDACGATAALDFEPTDARPVYCAPCFKHR